MAGKPAATVGSNHTCPMCSGTIPHVGGPIVQGEATVLFNNKPAATLVSMCTCVGPPDTIAQGNPTVFINGKPAACVGDMTAHGGIIVSGEATILIGTKTPEQPTTITPAEMNDFPEITTIDKIKSIAVGQGKNLKEAQEKQKEVKKYGYLLQVNFSA
ncbi:hypothetical protein AB832_06735 [Flavobacteriaceae bacterium (ex Bugula neritina AB1)]|nr:hypothetical protein AB832_06735 [Flavobacteriaceae bacterium (ex Bugula neritina AB1)]